VGQKRTNVRRLEAWLGTEGHHHTNKNGRFVSVKKKKHNGTRGGGSEILNEDNKRPEQTETHEKNGANLSVRVDPTKAFLGRGTTRGTKKKLQALGPKGPTKVGRAWEKKPGSTEREKKCIEGGNRGPTAGTGVQNRPRLGQTLEGSKSQKLSITIGQGENKVAKKKKNGRERDKRVLGSGVGQRGDKHLGGE